MGRSESIKEGSALTYLMQLILGQGELTVVLPLLALPSFQGIFGMWQCVAGCCREQKWLCHRYVVEVLGT